MEVNKKGAYNESELDLNFVQCKHYCLLNKQPRFSYTEFFFLPIFNVTRNIDFLAAGSLIPKKR